MLLNMESDTLLDMELAGSIEMAIGGPNERPIDGSGPKEQANAERDVPVQDGRDSRNGEKDVRGLRSLESVRTSKGMNGEHVDVLRRPEKDDDGSGGKPPNGSRNKYADGFVLQPTADTEHMQTTICPTFTRNQLENRNSRKIVGAIDALIPSSTGP